MKKTPPPEFIDPQSVRNNVQKAYDDAKTGAEFFAALNKKQYSLGRGLKDFAIIDKNGSRYDIDTLLGEKAAKELNDKFPDLAAIRPYPVSEIIRRIKAHRRGNRFKESSSQPRHTALYGLTKAAFGKAAKETTQKTERGPKLPTKPKKGWPPQAIVDWEMWGHENPQRFFALWPELAPENFVFKDAPSR